MRDPLHLVKVWEENYNEDADRMVDECYAPDCEVRSMLTGFTLHGRDELRCLERQISERFAERRMEVVRTVATGNVAAVEMRGLGYGGEPFDFAVFLTFNDEGYIVSDHSYFLDPTGLATD